MSPPTRKFYLSQLFGDTVQVKIIEVLLQNLLQETNRDNILWVNFSEIAAIAHIAKSSSKRVLDELVDKKIVEEKQYQTHAQNPTRYVRLNIAHPAINELLFFYQKVRGVL